MKRRGWTILIILIVLVVAAVLILPHFLNANTYRPQIEAALSQQLGRPVTLGHLSLSIFGGTLVADKLAIADDPHFSSKPFLQASDIKIGVQMKPLIFNHQLHITHFTIDNPRIDLLRAANGTWNYSSLGNATKRAPDQQTKSTLPNLSVGSIQIKNGYISMADLSQSGAPVGKPRVISGMNASIQRFSLTNWFPFNVSAHLPTNASLSISGTAGPIDQQDASLTPLNAQVTVKNLDLTASGFVNPGQGIEGLVDLTTKAVSNGHILTADGTLTARHLQLAKDGSPSQAPVDIKFALAQDLNALTGTIQHATVTIGQAVAQITGTYKTAGPTTDLNLHANAQAVPIDQLEAFLPSLGVHLPTGSRLQGGTLTTSLDITGPAPNPTIHGPLSIADTQLAGFNLGAKLQSISALLGQKTASATTIRSLNTALTDSPAGIRTDNLQVDVTGIGTASGNGTIAPGGALNYQVNLKLAAGGIGGTATQLASLIPGAGNIIGSTLRNGIPVDIGGTTSDPSFKPNLGALGKASPGQPAQKTNNPVGGILNKILGGH